MRSSDTKSFLKGVPYAVIGGHAVAHYLSVPPTGGLDVLIAWRRLADAETWLEAAGARRKGDWAPGGSVWTLAGGEPLILMALEEEWVDAALKQREKNGGGHPWVGEAWLVLMKMRSFRTRDVEDAQRLLDGADAATLRAVRRAVRTYQPQDAEDLESMIQLSRLTARRKPAAAATTGRRPRAKVRTAR